MNYIGRVRPLGFSFYCGRSRKGKPWILPKTAGKKFRKKLKAMKVWLYRRRTLPLNSHNYIVDSINELKDLFENR